MHREEIDTVLAIVLLCCTGFGFIIYLIYHYSKPKNRCVHCNSICQATLPSTPPQALQQLQYQKQTKPQNVQVVESHLKFCSFCGNKLDEETKKFCPSCGSKL
jgi:hypothetical protein